MSNSNVVQLVHSAPAINTYESLAAQIDRLASRDGIEMVNWWLWQQQIRLTCQRIKGQM